MALEDEPQYRELDPYVLSINYDSPRPARNNVELTEHQRAVDTVYQQQPNILRLVPELRGRDVEYGGYESHFVKAPNGDGYGLRILIPSELARGTTSTILAMAGTMDLVERSRLAQEVQSSIGIGHMTNYRLEFYIPNSGKVQKLTNGKSIWGIEHPFLLDGEEVIGILPPRVTINPGIVRENTSVSLSKKWIIGREGIMFRCFKKNGGICFEIIEGEPQNLPLMDSMSQQYNIVSGIFVPSTSVESLTLKAGVMLERKLQSNKGLRELMNTYINILATEI